MSGVKYSLNCICPCATTVRYRIAGTTSTMRRRNVHRRSPEPNKIKKSSGSKNRTHTAAGSKGATGINDIEDDSLSDEVDSSHTDVETLDQLMAESLFQRDEARSKRSRAQDQPEIAHYDTSKASHSGRRMPGLGTEYVKRPMI
jgi:hypothetical protein